MNSGDRVEHQVAAEWESPHQVAAEPAPTCDWALIEQARLGICETGSPNKDEK